MIVVDTNVTVYLYIRNLYSEEVKRLLRVDSEWVVPQLWRFEFRNSLMQYVRHQNMPLSDSLLLIEKAEERFDGRVGETSYTEVMALASRSQCSAYDCEFVALARKNDVKLVTYDKRVLQEFPEIALRPLEYIDQLNNEENA